MQECGHGHFVHHQNHEILHAFVMWSSWGHFEPDYFGRTELVWSFWPQLKRSTKEVILQVYFVAITKQRNVSLLSAHRSQKNGSRNGVRITPFCDNTVRTMKSRTFPRSRIFRHWPMIRGKAFLLQNSNYTNFIIPWSRYAIQRSRFFLWARKFGGLP